MAAKCYLWSWRTHNTNYDWKAWCKQWGKHWCYQLEKGEETGRLHFQGIISLQTKRTKKDCLSVMSPLPEYFEPVSNPNIKGGTELFYVTKPDTRVEGPWTDKDKQQYIPRQYRDLEKSLYPWQQTIWDAADVFEKRTVNLIVDKKGCSGKSTLAALMELHGRGIDLPPVNDAEKLVQSLADILIAQECINPRTIFVDIPRAMKQDKLYGMYTAIEQIKKGKVVDTRYSYKYWWFDAPQVWVFANTVPDFTYLSEDRWKFWSISEEKELTALTLEEL